MGSDWLFPETVDAEFGDCGGLVILGSRGGRKGRTFAADAFPEFFGEFRLGGVLLEVIDMNVTIRVSDLNVKVIGKLTRLLVYHCPRVRGSVRSSC